MTSNIAALKTKTFPWKLHAMLQLVEQEGFGEVVSWLPDGKSFKVHDPEAFVEKIMPNFFQQSKYKSFQRQLNLWGFERITNGIGKGGYARFDFFSRENPDEIIHIKRRKIKNTSRLMRKKKNAVNIVGTTVPQTVNIDNINSMNLKHLQSSSTASIVSHNYSDVSSISSDSDSEHPSSINDDFSPVPIFEITKDDECPQTGDCLDFEGRSYFFVDEEEVEATRISPASKIVAKPLQRIQTHTTAAPITLCPSSIAGIALYREFFSRDIMMQRFGSLQTS